MTIANPPAARADAAVATHKATCNFCKAVIIWARTSAKFDATKMPVDVDPDEGGNVLLTAHDTWGLIASVLGTKGARAAYQAQGWNLYLHHRLSCPFASKWSGKPEGVAKPAKTYKRRSRA